MEIKDCIERGIFCLVYGATGTGKTYNILKTAKELGYNVEILNGAEVKELKSSGKDFLGNNILYVIDNLDFASKKIQKDAMKYFVIATTNDLYALPKEYRNLKNKRQFKRPNIRQKLNFAIELNNKKSYGLMSIDLSYIAENSNNYWDVINNCKLLYASSIDKLELYRMPQYNPFEEFSMFMKGKLNQTKMTESELEIWALDNTNCNGKAILSMADILLGNNWSGYRNPIYAKEVIRLTPVGQIKFPKTFMRKKPTKKVEKKKPKKKQTKKVKKKKEPSKTLFDFI